MFPPARVVRPALVLVAVAGATVSLLLAAASPGLGGAAAALLQKVCAPGPGADCAAALSSRWAQIGPLPTAVWGFSYFSFFAFWYAAAGLPNYAGRFRHLIPVLAALVGAAVSLFLLFVLYVRLPARCHLCTLAHAANLLLVLGTVAAWPRRPTARTVGEPPVDRAPRPARGAVAAVLAISAAWTMAAGAAMAARYYYISLGLVRGAYLEAANNIDYVLWRTASSAPGDIPIRPDDPALGPPDAPHVLVVFMDFQCPHCRDFESYAPHLLDRAAGRLRIVFKHYPMWRACAPDLPPTHDTHPRACDAALAFEAARMAADSTERLFAFRRALFDPAVLASAPNLQAFAGRLGLDPARFAAGLADPAARSRIAEDVALARRLDVEGSGVMFLDGRRLPAWYISTTDPRPQIDELQTFRLWNRLLSGP